jgi:hypothetical protein
MPKLYQLFGYFLIGISVSGGLGYAIKSIPKLSEWGIYLLSISILTVLILIIVKDLLVDFLEITDVEYIGWLILFILVVIIGVPLQMR